MSVLAQAQAAAITQDWSAVSNSLAEISVGRATAREQSQILDLALQVLTAGDFQDSWQVAKVLSALGEMAIPPLLLLLQSADLEPDVQWLLGRILSEFKSDMVAERLAQCLLQYPDAERAEIALQALIQMGQVAIDRLTLLLATNKLAAVTALAQIRHSQTIAPLLTVVDDPDPQIRCLAIEALSSFHDPRIPPLLIQHLTDVGSAVRRVAVTGLGLRADLHPTLPLVPLLQPRLLDLNRDVCLATAIALGRIGDESAAASLFHCYQQSTCPEGLSQQIVQCLGWIDQPFSIQYLQVILTTTQQLAIVPAVIRVMGQSQQPLALQILIDYLRTIPTHCPALIKQEIVLSLGNFGKTAAVEEIIKLLADSNEQVRWHVIYCLEQFDAAIVDRQLQLLQESTVIRPELRTGIEQYRSVRGQK
jgi:HEAT repeat protein